MTGRAVEKKTESTDCLYEDPGNKVKRCVQLKPIERAD